jgi:antitoxin VapB
MYIHMPAESDVTKATTRTFRSGNGEAVRLPRDMAFGADVELTLVRSGEVLTIYPSRISAARLVDRLADLPCPTNVEIRDEKLSDEL